jgi:protein SCO1/2
LSILRWFGVLAVFLALGAACGRKPVVQILDVPADTLAQSYWQVPPFALTERNGRTITRDDLAGKVWVVDFFYTTCPGPCPMLSSRLSEIQKEIGGDDRVRLVSISTDPEKDTPEILQLYAKRFEASERWLFLTGNKEQIYQLGRQGFKVPIVEDRTAADPITHSTRLILVDQSGAIRGFHDGIGPDGSKQLVRDIRRLLAETP